MCALWKELTISKTSVVNNAPVGSLDARMDVVPADFHQAQDFGIGSAFYNGNLEKGRSKSGPEVNQSDLELVEVVFDLIYVNHPISRAELAKQLGTSESQV